MSRPLWKELEQTDFFKEARTVLLYWSMDDEVFTHDYVCKWAGENEIKRANKVIIDYIFGK